MWGIELTAMLAMVAVNAVFAGYEIALAAVSPARLRALAEANTAGARAALHMKENVNASLAAVQLGITLFGVVAAATGGAGARERIAPALQETLEVSAGVAVILAIALGPVRRILRCQFAEVAFDAPQGVVDQPALVEAKLQRPQDAVEQTAPAELGDAVVDRLPLAVAVGQLTPGSPGVQPPEDAVEDCAVVLPLPAPLPGRGGKKGASRSHG